MAICSIIGHRESEFVDEVWEIVSSLQSTDFSSIKMAAYDCRNESSILKTEKETVEKRISKILNKEIKFQYFDEIVKCEKSYNAGKNAS